MLYNIVIKREARGKPSQNGVNIMKKSVILESWETEQIKAFGDCVKKSGGRCVVCSVNVAKSGMSRKIKFLFSDEDMCFRSIYRILQLAGFKPNDYGEINVRGCGMDMIWATLMTIYEFCGIDSDNANRWASNYTII